MLALAASVLVRRGLLVVRANGTKSLIGGGSSYGGRTGVAPWKDRV
jgi:hypothetical protein